MAKKTYTIKVKGGFITVLLRELNAWGVDKTRYRVEGDVITTVDANVVDVVTETFIRYPGFYEITTARGIRREKHDA